MAMLHSSGYIDPDVKILIEKLAQVYKLGGKSKQLTLDGTPSRPYPVARINGVKVRGPPISEARFRVLEEIPHDFEVVAVDAAARILFDAGSYKIVAAKVVAGVWKGVQRIKLLGPYKRLQLFDDLKQAGDWLAEVELEAVLRLAREHNSSFILLDRPLVFSRGSRAARAYEMILRKNWRIIGIPKTTSLKVSSGESLVGYLYRLGEKYFKGLPWVYYPVFESSKIQPGGLSVSVARLSGEAPPFRVDTPFVMAERLDAEETASILAYLQDFSSPGYPLPLKIVHELSRISENELDLDRSLLMEDLSRSGLSVRLVEDAAGSEYKSRYIWGMS
ncbi:MAG: DNA double-strand break repair nuclease NurA [Infirmifilum sp.]|jgi:hypothetical protein|nr:DNA double-strand break repair nuclease NurA [Infirmifilum uzonense]